MGHLHDFDGKEFVSVTASDLQLGDLADKEEVAEKEKKSEEFKPLVERMKLALGEEVVDVRVTDRLTQTPAVVVAEQGQILTQQMRRMLEAAGQTIPEDKFILEINPTHALLVKAAAESDEKRFAEWSHLILDQALFAEQGSLKDPNGFIRRMNELMLG